MDLCLFARPHLAPGSDPAAFLEIARIADRAGMHSIAFGEHLVIGEDTSRYPYGPWIHKPDTPWFDPLITMACLAAVTSTLRLSTGVLLAPLRPGLVTAKEVATLDVMSAGRAEIGIGTGWQSEEYTGVGLQWAGRQRRFDEVIETCRAAWGEQPFSVTVDGTRLAGLVALPVPVQPRIPIYYGVKITATNARRVARLGDGWTPVGVSPDQVRDGVDQLRRAYEQAGRNPSALVVRVPLPPVLNDDGHVDMDQSFTLARPYVDAGATMFQVGFNHRLSSVAEGEDLINSAMAAATTLDPR